MLQKIRENSGSWVVKAIFSLTVLSFLGFGMGDIFLEYTRSAPVLTVGNQKLRPEEFSHRLAREKQRLSAHITDPQQLNTAARQAALADFTRQSLLNEEVSRLHLHVPDEVLREFVHRSSEFRDSNGHFDKTLFQNLLRTNELSEAQYLRMVKEHLLLQQMLQPLHLNLPVPEVYAQALNRALNEEKQFVVVTVTPGMLKNKPTLAELEAFYQKNKENFKRPQLRQGEILLIDSEEIKKSIAIDPAAAQNAFHANDYAHLQKRTVKEWSFTTQNQALQAKERLQKGGDVPGHKTLGPVEKQDLPEVVANVVFDLPEQTPSAPVKFGPHWKIYRVEGIQEVRFEDVQAQITDDLRQEKLSQKLTDLHRQVEDALAGGMQLRELAQDLKLPLLMVRAHANGLDDQGQPVQIAKNPQLTKAVLKLLFELDQGQESPVTEVGDSLAFVVQVEQIQEQFIPPFAQIQAQVASSFEKQARRQIAAQMAENLGKLTSLEQLQNGARQYGLKAALTPAISRTNFEKKRIENLPSQMMDKIFGLSPQKTFVGDNGDNFVVVMLHRTLPFQEDAEKLAAFKTLLQKMYHHDLESVFIASLKKRTPIQVGE